MAEDQSWAFPTPLDIAVEIVEERDDAELGLYEPDGVAFGPIVVADDKDAFDSIADEYSQSGSQYPTDAITLDVTAEDIHERDTIVDSLTV